MLDLNLKNKIRESKFKIEEISLKDIAIIGVSAKMPKVEGIDEFWELLCNDIDCIDDFPESRKNDVNEYFYFKNQANAKKKYSQGAYLREIDKFDYEFFKITPKEASLMDPNQRLFLETAWNSIEDAGYGPNNICGTKTGVFVGYSGKSEYQTFISEIDPKSIVLSEAGNINSIIASRIAYILDLKGPSMIVDTACSSSLVSVHLACQALRNRECEMAIAGSIKILMTPIESQEKLGIESSTARTRTFDDNSDGTGFGEGAISILLKPLGKAIKDKDNIYAVIKGSAINQDGKSIGITAPNILAQEEVLVNAWKEAEIEPETITYIEAHGTGTVLGDPIEVNAISKAFKRFTNKKQFCAIGSVKTVVGHLDYAAGIVGLLKAVLAIKNGAIPANLNFNSPNRKINFIESPVYINDRLSEWKTDNYPRRCGISSFGLSGTNCHVVLEQAPKYENENMEAETNIFSLSAKNSNVLKKMVLRYIKYIENQNDIRFNDICYTVNTGRKHHNYRIAIIVSSLDELIKKLKMIEKNISNVENNDIYYGEYKIVSSTKKITNSNEIYEYQKNNFTLMAKQEFNNSTQYDKEFYHKVCNLYIKGADILWEELYKNKKLKKISLPGYAFENNRCWPNLKKNNNLVYKSITEKEISHPLFDRCITESVFQDIYLTEFNVNKHWVLSEHRISEKCLAPGTTYLEMIRECSKKYFGDKSLEMKDVLFISPLIVEEGEVLNVQTIIKKEDGYIEFLIASKQNLDFSEEESWTKFCEGKVYVVEKLEYDYLNIDEINLRCKDVIDIEKENKYDYFHMNKLNFGPRWRNLLKSMRIGDMEALVQLSLPEEFQSDMDEYNLHPSLMDIAVNAITQVTGHGMYLPLAYGSLKIYSSLPQSCYSYIKIKEQLDNSTETISLDISITDDMGNILIQADNFTIKKIHKDNIMRRVDNKINNLFYDIKWVPEERYSLKEIANGGKTIIFGDNESCFDDIIDTDVIKVNIRENNEKPVYKKISSSNYVTGIDKRSLELLFNDLAQNNITRIIHVLTLNNTREIEKFSELENCMKSGVYSLCNMVKAICASRLTQKIEIILLSKYAYGITGKEPSINAHYAAFLGLGKTLKLEYPNLDFRCIDIDDDTSYKTIMTEIGSDYSTYNVAFRNEKRYIDEIVYKTLDNESQSKFELKEDGVYIITGGTGGIGREVAKFLASKGKINIVIISRSGINSEQSHKDNSIITKMIEEIEKMGSRIIVMSADVSDMGNMEEVINKIKYEYGKIRGVIHAAGVAGDGYLIRKTDEKFKEVIAPKVYGTWILDDLTKSEEMDFFICFSSISSLYGIEGQSDYIAANSYLDSFTEYRNNKGRKTLTINWAAWKEVGMAVKYGIRDEGIFKMLSINEAILGFEQILNSHLKRIIIGTLDINRIPSDFENIKIKFSKEIQNTLKRKIQNNKKFIKNESLVEDMSIDIGGKIDGSYTKTEKALAQIWGKVLGMKDVDIYESFNVLGGDSITATSIFKEIDILYSGVVDIANIFTHPSVSEMASYIDEKLNSEDKTKFINEVEYKLEEILRELQNGDISVDVALKVLE